VPTENGGASARGHENLPRLIPIISSTLPFLPSFVRSQFVVGIFGRANVSPSLVILSNFLKKSRVICVGGD